MTHNELLLRWAKWYQKQGFAPFPVDKGKKPLIKWGRLQEEQTTLEEVEEWWSEKFIGANIGLVTGKKYGLIVLDIDSPGAFNFVEDHIPDSLVTPVALTPRHGTGEHLYFAYRPGLANKADVKPGLDIRSDGGFVIAPPSKDERGSYKWQVSIANTALSTIPDQLYAVLRNGTGKFHLPAPNYDILKKGRRDEDLFHLANCLVKGGCETEMIIQALEKLAACADPPFPEKEIPAKVASAVKRAEARDRRLTDEVREWVLLQEGYFLVSELTQALQLATIQERKHATVVINRLKDQGLIEKYGERRGCYRLVDTEKKTMEFIEGDIQEYDIELPLGISDKCVLHPKNIVMIAGTKGSGKTAFLLNTITRNCLNKKIVYFNSEMGPEEWSLRLKNMGFRKKEEITWESYQRSRNFHDCITGEDKIFIVDFMEVHDNFYEIAKSIRLIHEKLDKGICLIAVQKKAGLMLGRGAEFSIEKARLYLSLDYNYRKRQTMVTIVDAKHPRNSDEIVTGLRRNVKIVKGTQFLPLSDWYPHSF